MKVDQRLLYVPGDVLETLINCRGYYDRPRPGDPLVGYNGTHEVSVAGEAKRAHYVGYKYFNYAKLEQYPLICGQLAFAHRESWVWEVPDVILGAPMGGILYAGSLALAFGSRVVFAEKKITKTATGIGERDETKLVLDRHEIAEGDKVVICEDICNNFSTTKELIALILSCGAIPYAIACIINRSGRHAYEEGEKITPLNSLATIPTEQFRQDDPEVAEDVAKGNVIWKPKSREAWAKLTALMTTRIDEGRCLCD